MQISLTSLVYTTTLLATALAALTEAGLPVFAVPVEGSPAAVHKPTPVQNANAPGITLPANSAFYGCTGQNCGGSCQFFDLATTPRDQCTKFLFTQMFSAMVYSKTSQPVNAAVAVAGDTSCSANSQLTLPHINQCYNFLDGTGAAAYATSFIATSGLTF